MEGRYYTSVGSIAGIGPKKICFICTLCINDQFMILLFSSNYGVYEG
jgi:hypothetical protein